MNYCHVLYLAAHRGILCYRVYISESTIDSEGFKGGTRGAPIMLRDAVSRTANVERTGRHKWVKRVLVAILKFFSRLHKHYIAVSYLFKIVQVFQFPEKV